jgi:hypothetical protein
MTKTRPILQLAVPLLVIAATACSNGSADPAPGPGSNNLIAGFTPQLSNPGPNTMSAAEAGIAAELVTVAIQVTDTANVFGSAFDLVYDPNLATFMSWSAGSLLEQGGNSPLYQVNATASGRLVVGASRTGSGTGANASGTVTLIHLTFRMDGAGSSSLDFQNTSVEDDSNPPQPIPGMSAGGGTLIAN